MERTTTGSDSERRRRPDQREQDGDASGGAGRGSVAALHDAVGNQAVQRQSTASRSVEEPATDPGRADTDGLCSRCAQRYRAGKPLNCRECETTLQRSVDSAARSGTAGGPVQPKLAVSQPHDAAEREAERVADETVGDADARDVTVSRQATGGGTVDGSAESRIQAATTGGRPLPESTRSTFESRFGRDFSGVRVHTGPEADAAARSIGAEAFTHGSDIVFARGNYRPNSTAGRQLLAHELTHVVQQRERGHRRLNVQRRSPSGSSGGGSSGSASSARQILRQAIDLFEASNASTSTLGRKAKQRLNSLYSNREIEIEDLEGATKGQTREGVQVEGIIPGTLVTPARLDLEERIAVDPSIRRDVAKVSLTLVHEAVHAVKDQKYVDEELLCRETELDFFQELLGGITVGGTTYRAKRGTFTDMDYQLRKHKQDQLVDAVFSGYYDKSGFYDAEWVENHLDDWGGLSNRWRFTKAMYLKKLVDDSKSHSESVLSILESETDTALKFRQMILWADMDTDELQEYFSDNDMLYVTEYVRRIGRIEQETGLDLIEAT